MKAYFISAMRRVIFSLLILLDVCINHLFNGRVETISSRAGRARASGRTWGCVLCRWLDSIDPDHCATAQKYPLGPWE